MKNRFDVERALWGYKAGDKVQTAVLRDGKLTTVVLTLSSAETTQPTALCAPRAGNRSNPDRDAAGRERGPNSSRPPTRGSGRWS